jgi:VWFA-related protein
MTKWVLAGVLIAAGTAWLALARPYDQGDDSPFAASPVVKLNVVAVDEHGQPVADLTREDFQVFDAGKAQHIAYFRRNDVKPLRSMPPGPNESSNRAGTLLSQATVILFDLLNARFEDRAYALNQVIPAVQQVESADSLFFYFLTMDGTLYPVHPLPDPESTTRVAAKPWTDEIKPLLDGASRKLFGLRGSNLLVDDRVHMTYSALGALASRVGATPGRKSIIWISHGVPISIAARDGYEGIDYTPLVRRLTATMDRANVAVYTLHLPGSLVPVPTGSTGSAGFSSLETLDEFAGLTGGRAYGSVDVARALTQSAADARLSYLIAYDPPLDKWDGKYHKIRVVCARKGVRLQTKQGYYAFEANAHEGDLEKAAFETAISSPFDTPEIGLSARLVPSATMQGAMNLEIRIDAADVRLAREGDIFTGQMAVGLAGYLANGRADAEPPSIFAPRLSLSERERAMKQGLSVVRSVNVPAAIRKIRVMVYDRASGALGSLTLPVPGTAPEAIH